MNKRVEECMAKVARAELAVVVAKAKLFAAKAALVDQTGKLEVLLSNQLASELNCITKLRADLASTLRSAVLTRSKMSMSEQHCLPQDPNEQAESLTNMTNEPTNTEAND